MVCTDAFRAFMLPITRVVKKVYVFRLNSFISIIEFPRRYLSKARLSRHFSLRRPSH